LKITKNKIQILLQKYIREKEKTSQLVIFVMVKAGREREKGMVFSSLNIQSIKGIFSIKYLVTFFFEGKFKQIFSRLRTFCFVFIYFANDREEKKSNKNLNEND